MMFEPESLCIIMIDPVSSVVLCRKHSRSTSKKIPIYNLALFCPPGEA